MDMEQVRSYVRLRRRQKELSGELDAVKAEADAVEQALLETFSAEGLERLSVDGTTVFLHRQLWARAMAETTRHHLVLAMKEAGMDHFVSETVNYNTLSSWVRDLDREGEPLPAELQEAIRVDEVFSLRTRLS